jgi:acetamidase/formamidase
VPSIHMTLEQRHLAWDNSLEPAAVIGPGDELTLDLADASGGQIDRHADASAIAVLDFAAVNPCTGPAPLLVPTMAGGNMDIPQLGPGSTLHLPAQVEGGLLSAGDTHAVQGDGEVCGTGAETSSTVRLRVNVVSPARSSAPWYEHSVQRQETVWTCTTGIGPDLFQAARDATRRAVDLVATRTGLEPVDAYLLLSLTGDLRVSEIVDAPNWVVSMHVPTRYTLG